MFATASRLPFATTPAPTSTTTGATSSVTGTNSHHHHHKETATSLIALFRSSSVTTKTSDDDDESSGLSLQIYALQQILYICLPSHEWSMIVTILPDLEAIAEDEDSYNNNNNNKQRRELSQLAAAIASKVFFYLEEPNSALRLALLAGPHCPLVTTIPSSTNSISSNQNNNDPYVMTLVRAALDAYIQTRQNEWEKESKMLSSSITTTTTTTTTTTVMDTLQQQQQQQEWNIKQLQPIIDSIIETAISSHEVLQYKYVIGICYDARDISHKLQYVLQHAMDYFFNDSNNKTNIGSLRTILQYAMECVINHTIMIQQNDRTLSQLAFTTLCTFYQQLYDSNTTSTLNNRILIVYDLVQTYHYLNESKPIAKAIQQLLLLSTSTTTTTTTPEQIQQQCHLTALQIAFDLVDTGDQIFCQRVADTLRNVRPPNSIIQVDTTTTTTTTATTTTTTTGQQNDNSAAAEGGTTTTSTNSDTTAVDIAPTSTTTTTSIGQPPIPKDVWDHILHVLTGGFVSELILSFRHRHSNADIKIMELLKKNLEDRSSGSNRNSVLHTTAIVTHSYLYAGTTNDTFLRNHLDWMKKASHWAKFIRRHSRERVGVIHADHVTEAMQLLQPYLPSDPDDNGGTVSPTGGYAEGGSLYALGLIHGSSGMTNTDTRRDAATFVRKHLRASHVNDAISHGACLAVGLTCFGSADPRIVQELKDVLDTDFAVAGEAAGMAIGMVLVGTGAGNLQNALPDSTRDELMDIVSELKNYARETQHEKIIRGIAMGIAIMNFGQEDNADVTIEEMRTDRDPIMRYGAQYAIALAYCGTGSNKAIRILLHTAVSDVSDDVRMAAVIGLAFVLFKTPERVPQLVKLLLESFNPHVRYASCMAVGIAMAGTGDSESIALLEPMLDDMTDYVRQGALMGTAMIYMQQSDTSNGRKIRSFRDKLSTLVSEKHQSTLTKMGAVLSIGIMDAGGRNCALQLGSRTGFTKMTSAVGLALWLQHWHWFPMTHMFSLALTPTLTIGLNKDLKYPKTFEIICNAKPSQFAFPKKLQEKKEKVKKHVETFTLSTTAKEKARLARKKAKEEKETMDEGEDAKSPAEETEEKSGDDMDVDKEVEEEVDEEEKPRKKREPEPLSFSITNPARVTKAQSPFCSFDVNQRYRPIRADESPYGVIMLHDHNPEEEEYIGSVKSPSLEPLGELAPPEPFEWIAPPLPEYHEDENEDDKDVEEASE